MSRLSGKYQKLREGYEKDSLSETTGKVNSDDTLISDFYHPEL
jgi:hypothetical protein